MKIVVLGFDGFLPSAMVGVLDIFALAEHATTRMAAKSSPPSWEVLTASADGQSLTDGRGASFAVDAALSQVPACDAVLIPGLVPSVDGLPRRSPAMSQAQGWLRARHAAGALVGGSCAGVFALGVAGVLDGRRCTTTWWLQDELKHRFPRAVFIWGAGLLEDERVVTVGGPMSWADLSLHMIRRLAGDDLARLTADFAVADHTPPNQTVFSPHGYARTRDAFVRKAEQAVRTGPPGLTSSELAQQLAVSERTLHRRLKADSGEAPWAFITRVRMEAARMLLEDRSISIKRIAHHSGYSDESSFRRAFNRFAGMGPSEYRAWVNRRRGIGT